MPAELSSDLKGAAAEWLEANPSLMGEATACLLLAMLADKHCLAPAHQMVAEATVDPEVEAAAPTSLAEGLEAPQLGLQAAQEVVRGPEEVVLEGIRQVAVEVEAEAVLEGT